MKTINSTLLTFLVMLTITGCSDQSGSVVLYKDLLCRYVSVCSVDQQIIGKWYVKAKGASGDDTIEFFIDHTCMMSEKNIQLNGKWNMVGDDRIKMDVLYSGSIVTYLFDKVVITGNAMATTATINGGTADITLLRVNPSSK